MKLPHNLDAEASVLGAILLRNAAMTQLDLKADDFFDPRHREVYTAMQGLSAKQVAIDPVTLESELGDRLPAVGGLAFLSEMLSVVPTADNIDHYARIVAEKAAVRRVMLAASDIIARGSEDPDSAEYLDLAERSILESARTSRQSGPRQAKSGAMEMYRQVSLRKEGNGITGIPSGFPDLDALTAGFQPGALYIVAARPRIGKTVLAMNIVEHAAITMGIPCLVFSLEMSELELHERIAIGRARLDNWKVARGRTNREDLEFLQTAAEEIAFSPLYIDDRPALGLGAIRGSARRWRASRDVFEGIGNGLVVIDYLQLMSSDRQRNGNREQEVAEISKGLKALAREIGCPVICVAQLNRNSEQQNRRPMLSDLRESGSIEQDADAVLFIHRDVTPEKNAPDMASIAEIILAKNRAGPEGVVELAFHGKHYRFDSLKKGF